MEDFNYSSNNTLLGVCTECGTAITSENDLGERTPKMKCRNCVEKENVIKERERSRAKINTKLAFILPAIIIPILCAVLMILTKYYVAFIVLGVLAYLATTQFLLDAEPIASIMEFFWGGIKWPFGLIFELSIDGILWYIAVKIGLWLLGIVLSILIFSIGAIISMAIAPFSFPFAVRNAIKHPGDTILDL